MVERMSEQELKAEEVGYSRGKAEAYEFAFNRLIDLCDKYKENEELYRLYELAQKAGGKDE